MKQSGAYTQRASLIFDDADHMAPQVAKPCLLLVLMLPKFRLFFGFAQPKSILQFSGSDYQTHSRSLLSIAFKRVVNFKGFL